ncbi:MAG TPA: DUF1330 domain-containing protein [Vicinamibacteria bacterium]|jgi:uncharacterized protein (DUF1330 family)|nr:DUF1330 domain-containing protein [Vicinamibacteria bacterium]
MKTSCKLALAVLAGVSAGVVGAKVIHAQDARVPPAYFIAELEVTDPPTMRKYGEKVPETLAPFSHHYVVRGGKPQPLEGEPPKGIVIIAFDSVAKAHEWYDSPAYEVIKPIRQSAAKSRIFIVEGVTPQ